MVRETLGDTEAGTQTASKI